LVLRVEGNAVNPLHLFARLVAPHVSTGYSGEPKTLLIDFARRGNMRTAAEINECASSINGDLADVIADEIGVVEVGHSRGPSRPEVVQQLNLEVLRHLSKHVR